MLTDVPSTVAYYHGALIQHVFGHYRDQLEGAIYSPATGQNLTYCSNDPDK